MGPAGVCGAWWRERSRPRRAAFRSEPGRARVPRLRARAKAPDRSSSWSRASITSSRSGSAIAQVSPRTPRSFAGRRRLKQDSARQREHGGRFACGRDAHGGRVLRSHQRAFEPEPGNVRQGHGAGPDALPRDEPDLGVAAVMAVRMRPVEEVVAAGHRTGARSLRAAGRRAPPASRSRGPGHRPTRRRRPRP